MKANQVRGAVAVAGALFLAAAVAAATPNFAAEGQRWWSHIEFLASPKLQGRMTGSTDYLKAAQYVAREFAHEGLKPAGSDGFYQPVAFEECELDSAHSSVDLVPPASGSAATPLSPGDAVLRAAGDPASEIEAPAVFVGYGISAPQAGYDDLAGLDLRGKIAVYLSGGPASIPDPLRAHLESTGERWRVLQQAGALGIAVIPNAPASTGMRWRRLAAATPRPTLELADPALRDDAGMKVDLTINPAAADRFFAGSGHTFAEIRADAQANQPLPKFPLAVRIRATMAFTQAQLHSPNVVGLLPGADPALRNQYVIVSAHLDHLGVRGGRIYPGALDNASGIAALIEIARDFRASHTRPRRSVLFLAVCGEEEGELGSWYFANDPTVPAAGIVADINMDMFLPLFPLQYLQVQGLNESTLGDDVRAAGQALGVDVIADEEPQANRFIRSDQYSFVKKGIPAIAFKFGYVKGSPQEKIYDDWNRTRYHQPGDDLAQPVDKTAAGKFCHLLFVLADHVGEDASRPSWEPTSFFRRFATR